MNKTKFLDFLFVSALSIIGALASFVWDLNFLTSTLLYFGLPSLWLSFRIRHKITKILLFSLLSSIPLTTIFDYLATTNKVWIIHSTIFPFRLFNVVVIEQYFWGFLAIYYLIIFYEYFFDRGKEIYRRKVVWKWVAMMGTLLLIFSMIVWINPTILQFQYTYLKVATVLFLIPLLIFVFYHPKILVKFLKIGTYFFFVALVIEIVGLKLKHWSFPGTDYLAMIRIGGLHFPIEELFFYFIIGAMAILSYYEFFDDDGK